MSMIDLRILLWSENLVFESFLKQEGVPFYTPTDILERISAQTAIVLLPGRVTAEEKSVLMCYLRDGGAVVMDRQNTVFLSELRKEGMSEIAGDRQMDLILFSYRQTGVVVFIHADITAAYLNDRPVIKEFVTAAGTVKEGVALTPKSRLRALLAQGLLLAARQKDIPFVKRWYYPQGFKSVFNFRFDMDEDTGVDTEEAAAVSSGVKDCSSWFVSCAAYEKNKHKVKKMLSDGFDLNSHGYYHHTYINKDENCQNIEKSLEYFKGLSCVPEGFSAPKGRWNKGLQQVFEAKGFLYSSEFAYDYDDFPRYPVIGSRISSVLQIPVHPLCWGVYLDAGYTDQEKVLRYFLEVMRKKYSYSQPVLLYGHPNEGTRRNVALLKEIYDTAFSFSGIWKARLSDIARWWKKRDEAVFNGLFFDRARKSVRYSLPGIQASEGITLYLSQKNQSASLVPLESSEAEIQLGSLKAERMLDMECPAGLFYQERLFSPPLPKVLKKTVADFLDWEKNTPLSAIPRNTLKNRAKYLLRKYAARHA